MQPFRSLAVARVAEVKDFLSQRHGVVRVVMIADRQEGWFPINPLCRHDG